MSVSMANPLEFGIEEFRLHWDIGWPEDACCPGTTVMPVGHAVDLHELMVSQAQHYWRNWPTADRACGVCGRCRPDSGVDPCLRMLPDVRAADCGHGAVTLAQVLFDDGSELEGFAALDWFAARGVGW